eukprot:SAG11_NODE_8734_length_981_cov_1.982993_2_plen_105_part_00
MWKIVRARCSPILYNLRFNVLLGDDFVGGGTAFPEAQPAESINVEGKGWRKEGLVVSLGVGDAVLHSGKLMHAGVPITSGTRYVLAGFFQLCVQCEDFAGYEEH